MAATAGVPAESAGLASGVITSARQIGGAFGLAAMATVAATATRHHHASGAATALAIGHDRAFLLGAATMLAGAAIGGLLPRGDELAPVRAHASPTPELATDET
jgi:hypothetical protein